MASASVGTYNIVPGTATVGDSGNNYAIVYVNGQLTVNPATLTITANNDSKTYGTTKTFATAFTYTIQVNGQPIPVTGTETNLLISDTITGVTETSTGASASELVGTYSIVPSAATGTGLGNYAISYDPGQLTVNPATLTITANNDSKTYGTVKTFSPTAYTETGLATANGDTIVVTETSTGAAASASVAGSPYAIVPSATVSDPGNYNPIVYVNGQLTVNPATLTITANSVSKSYGTSTTLLATAYTETGLVTANDDTITITGVTGETSTGASASASGRSAPTASFPAA